MKNSGLFCCAILSALLVTAGCGSSSSTTSPPVGGASPAAPTIASIAPSKIAAGSAATTVTLVGSGFLSTSVVSVGGVAEATTFTSISQLTASVPANQLAVGAELAVAVANGGTVSTPAINLEVDNPSPVLNGISPDTVVSGASATTLTLTGTGFLSSSVVQFNGSPRSSTYASATQLMVNVTAADLATAGIASVTVTNPSPGGGTSAGASLNIRASNISASNPALKSVSPNAAPIGTSVELSVSGSGFTNGTTLQWNGTALTTTYEDSTDLSAQVPASLLSLPGNYQVTVAQAGASDAGQTPLTFTGYVGIVNNGMVYNPTNGLFYVSVPSAAGPPYGNSVVSVDPATGALGAPIAVGSEPDKLAISSDGTTLWVGLDGASAIQEVNLQSGAMGTRIPLADNTGTYHYPPIVHALAVLPGTPNSIATSVATNNGLYQDNLIIYDNGVARAQNATLSLLSSVPAIFLSPSKAEIYATSSYSGYSVFSYDSSGLTQIASNSNGYSLGAPYGTELQVDNGRAYLDSGQILDAETTNLLGTIYSSPNVPAAGPMFSESTAGTEFVLSIKTPVQLTPNSPPSIYSGQIESFNESNLTPLSSALIPVNGLQTGSKYGAGNSTETELDGINVPDTLTRWGSDGLAFRAPNGIFSLRSNLVHDLSSVDTDLGISLATDDSVIAGTNATFTATITNGGPSTSTGIVMTGEIPANTVLVSASASQGTCFQLSLVKCSLGALANGAQATVSFVVQSTTPGQATATVQVSGSENDPNGGNGAASATVTVTGSALNAAPALMAMSPTSAQAGSTDLMLTLSGTGFSAVSAVLWNGTPVTTSFVSSTQLTAEVPAASISALGWAAVSVMTPGPGGGTTNALPFYIYNLISLPANHIVYDPYSRLLYASVNSSATQITGNSLVTIDPSTGVLGSPVPIGSEPDKMALSDDGQVLYVNEDGSSSVGRFNMIAQTLSFSFAIPSSASIAPSLRDIAVLPGSESTIAVDLGVSDGIQLFDIDPVRQTGTARGNAAGGYAGSSLQFLNPSTVFSFDIDTSGATLNSFEVSSSGLAGNYTEQYTLNNFSPFKIHGGMAFANSGGAADLSVVPPRQLGVYLPVLPVTSAYSYYQPLNQVVEPDPALSEVFFATQLPAPTSSDPSAEGPGLIAYNETTFMPAAIVPIAELNPSGNIRIESSYTDLVRWGQDGLALLTAGGQIAILRGPFVVPQLLNQNPAALLTSASPGSTIHGPSNLLLALTGSGFIPGAAAYWNGAYRTTTFVDSGHLTVAIPATDLEAAGSASVTVINPGASASSTLPFTIN